LKTSLGRGCAVSPTRKWIPTPIGWSARVHLRKCRPVGLSEIRVQSRRPCCRACCADPNLMFCLCKKKSKFSMRCTGQQKPLKMSNLTSLREHQPPSVPHRKRTRSKEKAACNQAPRFDTIHGCGVSWKMNLQMPHCPAGAATGIAFYSAHDPGHLISF
jgi:hypothetical protein